MHIITFAVTRLAITSLILLGVAILALIGLLSIIRELLADEDPEGESSISRDGSTAGFGRRAD